MVPLQPQSQVQQGTGQHLLKEGLEAVRESRQSSARLDRGLNVEAVELAVLRRPARALPRGGLCQDSRAQYVGRDVSKNRERLEFYKDRRSARWETMESQPVHADLFQRFGVDSIVKHWKLQEAVRLYCIVNHDNATSSDYLRILLAFRDSVRAYVTSTH
ncbi:hypothetical protein BV898_09167 [Hypsibius exemplaris]|uniref:Uncharacterized protein n=1 Tax=Hypsibius exemplaris TaxID=2072580 RepID=A0A1W0WN82_HYPEX|nr:hypothetical protein BV898_09167 [Hypsibius exemplaris]